MTTATHRSARGSTTLSTAYVMVAVALVALAGCHSGSMHDARTPQSAPTTVGSSSPSRVAASNVSGLVRQLDACIHDHGSPTFPDPYVDATGDVAFPADAPNLPAAAQLGCQSIIDQLPNPGNGAPTPIDSGVYQQWLHFAACMRVHGLPSWPDPSPDGGFPLPESLRSAPSSSIAPAFEACRSLDPNPDGKYTVSGSGS